MVRAADIHSADWRALTPLRFAPAFTRGYMSHPTNQFAAGTHAWDRAHTLMEDIEIRRRRASYRAWHRGTKEMDHLLGRYADAELARMDGAALSEFERLLALPDPDLQRAIMAPEPQVETELTPLIGVLRRFHGIDAETNR